MSRRLDGRVALVTGAARGIGRAVSVRLAEEGASIVATDLCGQLDGAAYPTGTRADLDETARLIEKAGGEVLAQAADVRDPTAADFEAAVPALNAMPIAWAEPADIADAVAWLASDESRYVTGAAIPVDAGSSQKFP